MTAAPACRDCRYSTDDSRNLFCRRFPPQFVKLADGGKSTVWSFPNVNPLAWCGEFQKKEQVH